jgi:hypothetical protein
LEEGKEDGEPFFDIREAAATDPQLEGQITQAHATMRTIRRAVQKANPSLTQTSVAMKPMLTEVQQEGRRAAAARLLRRGAKKLKWTVFADEASCEVTPMKKMKAWSKKGKPPPPINDAHKRNYKPMKLKWMGSVMHGVGAVEFQLLTGTTHFESAYKVCHASMRIYTRLSFPMTQNTERSSVHKTRPFPCYLTKVLHAVRSCQSKCWHTAVHHCDVFS